MELTLPSALTCSSARMMEQVQLLGSSGGRGKGPAGTCGSGRFARGPDSDVCIPMRRVGSASVLIKAKQSGFVFKDGVFDDEASRCKAALASYMAW